MNCYLAFSHWLYNLASYIWKINSPDETTVLCFLWGLFFVFFQSHETLSYEINMRKRYFFHVLSYSSEQYSSTYLILGKCFKNLFIHPLFIFMIYIYIYIHTNTLNPFTRAGYDSRSIFKVEQGRTHKRCTLMDPHTRPCKSRTTSTNIHSAAMWGYGMLSWRPT